MTIMHARTTSVEDVVLLHEIERALYDEAALLDAHDYAGWLAMLTDDVTYWMPIRETRSADEAEREFTSFGGGAYFDEDRRMLELRIEKRASGYAWAEDPPSRTRHCVTNVRILEKHASDDVTIGCNMVVYRSRLDTDEDWWVGRRIDRLRIVDGRWKLARREVYLDQTVLQSKNLSTFF
jgi:3-phenylpropionate/cinnamic acid dioxygenase small subunit